MNNFKILFPVVLYLLILFQANYLVHFGILGSILSFSLIISAFWNFFEKNKQILSYGLFLSVFSGAIADIYSDYYIGFNILIFVLAALFIKFILRKYVRIPFSERPWQ